jgi:hypothetical protein
VRRDHEAAGAVAPSETERYKLACDQDDAYHYNTSDRLPWAYSGYYFGPFQNYYFNSDNGYFYPDDTWRVYQYEEFRDNKLSGYYDFRGVWHANAASTVTPTVMPRPE